MDKKVTGILLVIISASVLVNVYLGLKYVQLQNNSNALFNERDELKSEIETLVVERDNAKAEVESFIGLNNALIDNNYELMIERDDLKNEVSFLTIERDEARATGTNLSAEIDSLKEPNVITLNLSPNDYRTSNSVHQLQFGCDLINVGGGIAQNVRINVEAHDSLGALVINTTAFQLFSMNPGSYTHVWVPINYEGQPLSNWSITTVWD